MDVFLVQLMVVFVLAVVVGILFRFFKLPSIIGHVTVGILVGSSGFLSGTSIDVLHLLGNFGVTLLLFLVGLEMNWKEVKRVGWRVLDIFLFQTVFTVILFSILGMLLFKLSLLGAIMMGISLAFCSTIVVVKSLSEKKDLSSFAGKLSLGVLLMQDLLAICLLVFVTNMKAGLNLAAIGFLIGKLFLLFLVINVIGHALISYMMKVVIRASEDLILFSLAWLLLSIYLSVNLLGLTPEVGAILAGISLSTSWGHFQIVSKVRTLRDIFVTVFFVLLGLQTGFGKTEWGSVVLITLLVIFGKFFITLLGAKIANLSGKVSFGISVNMTQISEFSLIVMSAGLSASLWNDSLVKIIMMSGLLSMAVSTILIGKSSSIFKFLDNTWPKIFRFSGDARLPVGDLKNHVVLLGGDRTGRSILSFLIANGEKVLVVDFNPDVVDRLDTKGIPAVFADCSDPDIIDLTNMRSAKMVISTIKDINDSLSLLNEIGSHKIKIPVIVDAEGASQAKELYEAGASYVIFPHFVSGMHLAGLMKKFVKDKNIILKYKGKQEETMREIYEGEYK